MCEADHRVGAHHPVPFMGAGRLAGERWHSRGHTLAGWVNWAEGRVRPYTRRNGRLQRGRALRAGCSIDLGGWECECSSRPGGVRGWLQVCRVGR